MKGYKCKAAESVVLDSVTPTLFFIDGLKLEWLNLGTWGITVYRKHYFVQTIG